ncbi:MAG: four helix bundle protein [Muribaculaceae bacterium]|nr:four helix bundle protein [Muribaculaceae bacterium]
MNNKDFKDLRVWRHSMAICKDIYKILRLLPIEERFALADQIRRSTISVPSNIAEGQRRGSDKEFLHFLSISSGSLAELMTQLTLCVDLEYVPESDMTPILNELEEIDKMLNGLKRSISRRL